MSDNAPLSFHIQVALDLIDSVKGQNLSSHEREKKAIELASLILLEAIKEERPEEKKRHEQLSRLMHDPSGKAFTTAMTDECFRTKNPERIADQMSHLIDLFDVPRYLPPLKRWQLKIFKRYGNSFASLLVPMAIRALRKEAETVIIAGENGPLSRHIAARRKEGVRLNINRLGEAILGEKEAVHRLQIYLDDLTHPDIDYISIKVSTIFSQINLLAFEESLEICAERLRTLYRQAMRYPVQNQPKFINLDMEEYRNLFLTKDLFMKVLSEEEFFHLEAGIVFQAYIPDSYLYLKELTEWAMKRVEKGGAPVKARIVKGANMAMEMVESALHGWAQAPYKSKSDTDSNYKRMVHFALLPQHAKAVHVGIASHNLFDIAYALIMRSEKRVEKEVSFEMLEGMANHIQRVVHKIAGDMLLYCAVATKKDFQSAIAYLIRRLDENTGPDNFLRHSFGLRPGTPQWELQAKFFSNACSHIEDVQEEPRRHFDRAHYTPLLDSNSPFENEPETDFALPHNRIWGREILRRWKEKKIEPIPLVIGGAEYRSLKCEGQGFDPSNPIHPYYEYALGGEKEAELVLKTAKEEEREAENLSTEKRCELLARAAQVIRERYADFLGAMVADGGKSLAEADVELAEGIDFIEYYIRQMKKIDRLADIRHTPKGTVLVTPPWNFPISIPLGGIVAALASGNCVILKPAPEAVLCGYMVCQALWDAGVSKRTLQFFNCNDNPVGSKLISDPRINLIILTGATSTARLFLKMRPSLDLSAETGGKNTMIISSLSDRDQACKDLIRSAFGHSGQKCSACSLAILEKEVYDDPHFLQQLKDAATSLRVGSAWDPRSFVTPLIREPNEALLRGLTVLESGEEWLVKPKQDSGNPNLYSPGIKLGVKKGSFTHQTELFGPILGLMRADDLDHALKLANDTPYGLTAALHSLDDREQRKWQAEIVAGNCYINRGTTGAIVQRQPFGGTKNSAFGPGRKAGGPNYLHHFMLIDQIGIPKETFPVSEWINNLTGFLERFELSAEALGIWTASVGSYAFWWEFYRRPHDPSKLIGQDNFLIYLPFKKITVRIEPTEKPLDFLRIFAAALTCKVPLEVSWERRSENFPPRANWAILLPFFNFVEESEEGLTKRMRAHEVRRLRLVNIPSEALYKAAAESGCYIDTDPVLANGRFELLHYLREVSLSIDYHRYGNLGTREHEPRHPVH